VLKVFKPLSTFQKIVVTGPQRSGTTICGKMISNDLKLPYIDESHFDVHDHEKFIEQINSIEKYVIQAPAVFKQCMEIKNDDIIVVIMKRNIEEILDSQKRIEWEGWNLGELKKLGLNSGNSCEEKYNLFKKIQPKNYMVINYDDLKSHDMWVDKKHRISFGPKQTEISISAQIKNDANLFGIWKRSDGYIYHLYDDGTGFLSNGWSIKWNMYNTKILIRYNDKSKIGLYVYLSENTCVGESGQEFGFEQIK